MDWSILCFDQRQYHPSIPIVVLLKNCFLSNALEKALDSRGLSLIEISLANSGIMACMNNYTQRETVGNNN